jgi:hypothetical protein
MKMIQATFVTVIGLFIATGRGSELKAQSNWEIGARFGDITLLLLMPRFHWQHAASVTPVPSTYLRSFWRRRLISTGCSPYREGLQD